MTAPFEGGCHCGAVRYVCSMEPAITFFCHCVDCQKTTGGPFAAELLVATEGVTISGELSGYTIEVDSGNTITRNTCAHCASPVIDESSGFPAHVVLRTGSLDDASWLQPQAHIWISRKQPWLQIGDDLPQFEYDLEPGMVE